MASVSPITMQTAESPDGVRRLNAAYAYRGVVAALIRSFKDDGDIEAARLLSGWMAGRWFFQPELGRPDAFIPVPLHTRRERFRGGNQARTLAEAVSRQAGIPCVEPLKRTRSTASQRGRSRRERLRVLINAFSVKTGWNVRAGRFVLIDDVATTGATLSACAQALRSAGAAEVSAYVLARKF
jgi:ComF family protein